jgi:N-acetylornithine carbamoyltransferase
MLYKNLLRGRDAMSDMDFSRDEVETILEVALDLKRDFVLGRPTDLLRNKTLFMIMYNPSLRTRNSFEAGMTQLGGHAHYLEPGKIYTPALEGDEVAYGTERVSDVARVLDGMGHAIALRVFGAAVNWVYGKGHAIGQEFCRWAEIPVFNMGDDRFHPTQALADMLMVKELMGGFRGVKYTMCFAYSPSVKRQMAVTQSSILLASLLGMDVTLCYPEGLEVEPRVEARCRENAERYGGRFRITHDRREGLGGAHIVNSKSWGCIKNLPPASGDEPRFEATEKIYAGARDWIIDEEAMSWTDKGYYTHCLPCDRGYEVANSVIDGPRSAAFHEARNLIHVRKALMALTMA